MKARPITLMFSLVLAILALLITFAFVVNTHARVHAADLQGLDNTPTVTDIQPNTAPNDLDTLVVISGTDFTAGMSGTQVITPPMVYLDSTESLEVIGVDTTTISASLPWGLEPGIYTLTVQNPDGMTGTLPNAFTVTQGIGVWNVGKLFGGSVSHVVVDPHDPNRLFASTGAGMFWSDDSAENWDLLTFDQHSPVFDPFTPNRLYAEGGPHSGGFLWRSDDSGNTWIPLTTTFPITQTTGRDCFIRHRIYPISGTVFVTACGADGGPSGLISSENNGSTWTPAMEGLTDTQVIGLAFHPSDPMTMYLGTANGNVFISQNGGASWVFASQPVSYVQNIAVAPYGSHAIWVSAESRDGDSCGLYKSTNPELTSWVPIDEPDVEPGSSWCDYTKMIFAPATWPDAYSRTLFVLSEAIIFTSTDDGVSFGALPLGKLFHNVQDLVLHPTDPNILYIGERGTWDGFYKSMDGGMSWQVANQGLTAIVPEQIIISPDDPSELLALSLERIYRGTQGGAIWQHSPISGVITMMLDPFTSTRLYAGVPNGLYISDDLGQSWSTYITITPPAEFAACGMWITELAASPSEPGTLVAAAVHSSYAPPECLEARSSMWRSTDYGVNWARIELDMSISKVNDIVTDPISPTIMYAAIGNDETGGNLLKSNDGGTTWAYPANWAISGVPYILAMEPGTHRIFASIDTHLPLYVSEDGGSTWSSTGDGGGDNINDILFIPGNPPVLYDAAVQGLYRSTDGAQTWEQAFGELGQVPVYSLAFIQAENRDILYVSTSGGYVEQPTSQVSSIASGQGSATILVGGVYRLTMAFHNLYLSLIAR